MSWPDDTKYLLQCQRAFLFITKVIHANNDRAKSLQFAQAMTAEVQGLKKRDTWRVVPRNSISINADVLRRRFVQKLRNFNSAEELVKSRFVAHGNRDKGKPFMVHIITALWHSSIQIITSYAVMWEFRIFLMMRHRHTFKVRISWREKCSSHLTSSSDSICDIWRRHSWDYLRSDKRQWLLGRNYWPLCKVRCRFSPVALWPLVVY